MSDEAGPVQRAILGVARRMGCTEGQVQTIAVGIAVALVAAVTGLPPVLRDRAIESAAAAPAPQSQAPAPTTTIAAAAPAPGAPTASAPRPTSSPGTGGSSTGGSGANDDDPPASTPTTATNAPPSSEAALGVPGTNGACSVEVRSIDNPRHEEGASPTPVWIYEPAGSADASITRGRCDDDERPALFFAHGFSQTDPVGYIALIEHLVSVGNIVVYPTYNVDDGERATLEESNRVVDAGIVAAVEGTPRIDTTRIGLWGHSHGGGMIPFLARQAGARGWGENGVWMSIVAQAYTQLVGADDIALPANAEVISVTFDRDALADARLAIDVFESLALPDAQKRHVTILSGTHDGQPFVAEHGAPEGVAGQSDAVDVLLWRYADLVEACALHDVGCDADLESLPGADGTPVDHAVVSADPVDVGPYPALLAECDAVFGTTNNPRIARCGQTRI